MTRRTSSPLRVAGRVGLGLVFVLGSAAAAETARDVSPELAAAKSAVEPAAPNRADAELPAKPKPAAPKANRAGAKRPSRASAGVRNTINVNPNSGEAGEIGTSLFSGAERRDDAVRGATEKSDFWAGFYSTDRALPQEFITVAATPTSPSSLTLSPFNGDAASGSVRSGTSWTSSSITQNTGSITVAGTAKDDNGWGITGLSLNATGMNYITINAQRDAGNQAGSFFIQFEDRNLNTSVFSIITTAFGLGTPTQAQIVIGSWPTSFDYTQIGGWSIGGGGVGTLDFRMTLFDLGFSATSLSAVPEPSLTAVIMGTAGLSAASFWRRRRRRDTQSSE